ncbi:hypothetical protein BS78_10G109500 [Paspalum vaginatum]|nr:hypothetical protein BS78_10G109500 [Paspalum vaginatum]
MVTTRTIGPATSNIGQEVFSNTTTPAGAAMVAKVVPSVTNIVLPTTCFMLALYATTSVNHAAKATSEDLPSENCVEAATIRPHAEAPTLVAVHEDVDIIVQHIAILNDMDCDVANDLSALVMSTFAKDIVPIPN